MTFELDRSKKKRGAHDPGQFRIETETVTMTQIAERLGLTRSTVESRMQKLRLASGPITWDRLRAFGKARAA